jgi:hypothetical protein
MRLPARLIRTGREAMAFEEIPERGLAEAHILVEQHDER